MSAPPGLFALILTTLGSGAVGAIVTTYGSQARRRRQARAQAREALRQVERLPREPARAKKTVDAIDAFEAVALVAGLPRALTDLYCEASLRVIDLAQTLPQGTSRSDPEMDICSRVASGAAELMASAIWHPWASAPHRWFRMRRLRRLLRWGMPTYAYLVGGGRRAGQWERRTIREGKLRAKNPTELERLAKAISDAIRN
jgi:hypothetical protein